MAASKRDSSQSPGLTDQQDRCRLSRPVHSDILEEDSSHMKDSYSWRDYLWPCAQSESKVVPVDKFLYAPLSHLFHHLRPSIKVEVANNDYAQFSTAIGGVYWVAFIVRISGYKALLRYEGYSNDSSQDFWINLCCADIHPVGWCANEGRPLVPPRCLQETEKDWKSYLVKRLTGCRTLPSDWHKRVRDSLLNNKLKVGEHLELLDRNTSTRVRPAIVKKTVGRRVHVILSLDDIPADQRGVVEGDRQAESGDWVDQGSALIFPVGWAARCGYDILATEKYKKHCMAIVEADSLGTGQGGKYGRSDALPAQFQLAPLISPKTTQLEINSERGDAVSALTSWKKGMKFECLDPLASEVSFLTVATVVDIMPCGYLKIGFDGPDMLDELVPLHQKSSLLFPIGYADANNIELKPPKGCDQRAKFSWPEYLQQSNSVGAPDFLFDNGTYDKLQGFEVGSKIEAVDQIEPHLVCVATVADRKGRLIKVHFDGWADNYDQLFDFRSPELMPLGWCEMAGYKLEGPKQTQPSLKRNKTGRSAGCRAKKARKE